MIISDKVLRTVLAAVERKSSNLSGFAYVPHVVKDVITTEIDEQKAREAIDFGVRAGYLLTQIGNNQNIQLTDSGFIYIGM